MHCPPSRIPRHRDASPYPLSLHPASPSARTKFYFLHFTPSPASHLSPAGRRLPTALRHSLRRRGAGGAAAAAPAVRPAGTAGEDPGQGEGSRGRPGRRGQGAAAGSERRRPRLPLSSVSGWTAVSVAMSAAGLEPE